MSEEGRSINESTNLSSDEAGLVSDSESKILAPVTEGGEGIVEAVTEEAMGEEGEPVETSTVEQPQIEGRIKPKLKQKQHTIMKIQKSLAYASKQIEKQTTQISKINQNLQSLQKQMRAEERQTGIVNQIRAQVNQIQKQISQVHKNVQKRSIYKLQSGKKVSSVMKKRKKNKSDD
jgi:predicted RNase H-like nuclease (RuvC/YqgF family)